MPKTKKNKKTKQKKQYLIGREGKLNEGGGEKNKKKNKKKQNQSRASRCVQRKPVLAGQTKVKPVRAQPFWLHP